LNDMKKRLYIGCALTNLPDDKRVSLLAMIAEIKKELGQPFEILEFVGVDDLKTNKPLTPTQVYSFDIDECLMKTDYFLAICDFPALGLGYELGTAIEKMGILVLAVAHENATVSRSIIGVTRPNYHFFRYNSPDEIIKKALEIFPH